MSNELNLPKFLIPISWMLLSIATIKDLDFFYGYPGIRSPMLVLVGVLAIIYFLVVYRSTDNLKVKRAFVFGIVSSICLLILPGAFNMIYPKYIEPSLVEDTLNDYLEKESAGELIIKTDRAKALNKLIKADLLINEGRIDEAIVLLNDLGNSSNAELLPLTVFSNYLNSKIHLEKGNFDQLLTYVNKDLSIIEGKNSEFYKRTKALLVNFKGITLSRQADGVESRNFFQTFDQAMSIASELRDRKLEASFQFAKSIAYQRYAVATKTYDDWSNWDRESKKAISLYANAKFSGEFDAVSGYVNGLRGWYSQLLDHDALAKRDLILAKHDSAYAVGQRLTGSSAVEGESIKRWTINSILFDYFTREPAKTNDLEIALKRLDEILPTQQDSYQVKAQWHQTKGLLLVKIGHRKDGEKELLESLKIWHETKQIAKQRELINDLLANVYALDGSDRTNVLELLLRWAGLRLLQRNFDPELNDRVLLREVIARLDTEKVINPVISKSMVRISK